MVILPLVLCIARMSLQNNESNSILSQMYQREDLFTEDEQWVLSDEQLTPMNKARLIEGMKTFFLNSGKKKWTDTLHKIETSANKEDCKC
jgi:hypothetical protein